MINTDSVPPAAPGRGPAQLAAPWNLVALAALLYTLLDVAWVLFHWGGPERAALINDLAALPPSLLAAAAAWSAALSQPRGARLRRAWLLLGLGLLAYFVGNLIWAYRVNVAHVPAFASTADVFYLALYPCLFGSVWFFAEHRADRRERLLVWLDLLTVITAAALIIAYFVLMPAAAAGPPDALTQAVGLAHALGLLVLIGALGAVLYQRPLPAAQAAIPLFVAGMLIFLAADIAFAITGLAGTYAEGGWVDAGWNVAQLCFILAAVRQRQRGPAAAARAPRWRARLAPLKVGFPLLAVAATYALVIYVMVAQFGPAAEWLLAGALFLTALMIIRALVTPNFRNLRIRTKVLLSLLATAALAVSLVTVTSYLTLRTRLEAAVGATLQVQTQAEAETIANQIIKQLDIMQGFALSYVLQDRALSANASYPADTATAQTMVQHQEAVWQAAGPGDPLVSAVLHDELAGHLKDFLAYFPGHTDALVTDQYGATLAATTRPVHYSQAGQGWWQAAFNRGLGAIYIGSTSADPVDGHLHLIFAQPVRVGLDGHVVGVMWMTYAIPDVVALLASRSTAAIEYDLLLPSGQMITPSGGVRQLDSATQARLAAAAAAAAAPLNLAGASELVSQAPVRTQDHVGAQAVRDLNWTLVARQDPAVVYAPITAAGQTAIWSTLLVFLLTIGLAALLAPHLVAPLARLTGVAQQIAAGDLSTRVPVESRDELGTLALAFNTMLDTLHTNINQLNHAQLALQESERRYRRLVDYFPDLVAVFGQDQFLFINPAGEKLLGVPDLAALASRSLLDLVLPADRERIGRDLRRSQAAGEPTPLLERQLQRLDGTVFDAEFRFIPITYLGQPAIQIMMRDITERQRAAAQVRQNAARAEALARMASLLNARLDPRAVSQAICAEAARALGVPLVLVGFMRDNPPRLELAHYLGLAPAPAADLQSMAAEYLRELTEHPEPVLVIPDLAASSALGAQTRFGPLGLRTLLAANLIHETQVVGVLVVVTQAEARVFSGDELALLKGLADQAALALSNARLFAEVQRQAADLEQRVAQRTEQLHALNQQLQQELAQRQALVLSLSESEQRFRLLFDASPEAMFLIDPNDPAVNWAIVDCNPAACQMNGYSRAELLGQSMDRLNAAHGTPAESRQDLENLRRLRTTPVTQAEHVHRDGHHFSIEYATALITMGERELILGIDRDITERKQSEAALQAAKDAAEAASRAKSEFLSRMSHELRTPMNAILGFAQLLTLSRKDPLTPGQTERVQQIVKGGRHLLDLINEILDLSRIEAGRLSVSPEPVQVMDALREVLDLTAPLAARGEVTVYASPVADANPYVLADRQRLKQVLLNLLSNAIKYNHAGGQVTVACQPAPAGVWRLSVSDTGPGLAPQDLERLFLPFERLKADQTSVEGTGLGLALAKRLIELMAGTIGVESALGEGSTFWVELPGAESQLKHLQHTGGTGPLASLPDSARRLLYIEDNPGNFELVRQVLADYSQMQLLWAAEARAGLALARQQRPDLILLDLHLGTTDGASVLRDLKNDPQTAAIPVLVVSADATAGQAERLRSLGAVAYLTKPLDVKQLVAYIETILSPAQP